MTSVWAELKRRNVIKVAAAYAVVGWLLVEVAATLLPIFEAPDWILQVFTLFVILGFPLALVLSWAYELTPQGIERTKSVPLSESLTRVTGRRLDFVIIGVLVAAVVFFVVERSVQDTSGPAAGAEIDPASLDSGRVEILPEAEEPSEARSVLPNSVAVLLCDNLSPDPEDAYVAQSIHEEILNQLVKIRNLNVIARTSVLRYANSPPPISQIAEELNVELMMECSVRYAGDAILVTAQLIDPNTNSHLWSNTYPGDLSDLSTVFAMQADIAKNIASALEAEFSATEQEHIESIPTRSPVAYSLYLRALRAEGRASIDLLDRAIADDPTFALAYAFRALNAMYYYYVGPGASTSPNQAEEIERSIRDSAEAALALDPDIGLAHAALGALHQFNWRGIEAETEFGRALELSPNNVEVLVLYARLKRYRGEYDESVRLVRRALALDPNNAFTFGQLALTHRAASDWAPATEACRLFLADYPGGAGCHIVLAEAEAIRGNSAEALAELELVEQLEPTTLRFAQLAYVYSLAGQPDDARRLFAALEEAALEEPVGEAVWSFANLAIGNYDQALQHLERAVTDRVSTDFIILSWMFFNPWRDSRLANPQFQELLDELWANG